MKLYQNSLIWWISSLQYSEADWVEEKGASLAVKYKVHLLRDSLIYFYFPRCSTASWIRESCVTNVFFSFCLFDTSYCSVEVTVWVDMGITGYDGDPPELVQVFHGS